MAASLRIDSGWAPPSSFRWAVMPAQRDAVQIAVAQKAHMCNETNSTTEIKKTPVSVFIDTPLPQGRKQKRPKLIMHTQCYTSHTASILGTLVSDLCHMSLESVLA